MKQTPFTVSPTATPSTSTNEWAVSTELLDRSKPDSHLDDHLSEPPLVYLPDVIATGLVTYRQCGGSSIVDNLSYIGNWCADSKAGGGATVTIGTTMH
jgi:hypothetical protein